jgi:tetratricopeptide (TPR) repeat protein
VTLYELTTGHLPFWAENVFDLKQKIDIEDPVEPRKINPEIDAKLNDLILRGLQKDPDSRFKSAQEMMEAFGPSAAGEIDSLREMFNEGCEADAETRARELLKSFPSEVAIYLLIGEFCNRRQQYAQAEEILRKGIAIAPERADLHFYLAPALWSQGVRKRQQALAEMERALDLGLSASQKKQAENLLKSWKRK